MLLVLRESRSQPPKRLAAKALQRQESQSRELAILAQGRHCGQVTSGGLIAPRFTAKTDGRLSLLGAAGVHPGSNYPTSGPCSDYVISGSQRAFLTKTRGRAIGRVRSKCGSSLRCSAIVECSSASILRVVKAIRFATCSVGLANSLISPRKELHSLSGLMASLSGHCLERLATAQINWQITKQTVWQTTIQTASRYFGALRRLRSAVLVVSSCLGLLQLK